MLRAPTQIEAVIQQRIEDAIALKTDLLGQLTMISEIADRLVNCYQSDHKALLFGNGGSAADAQHIATEFVGRFYLNRRALPAVALVESSSSLTAIGNDYGFERVFSRQIEAFGQPGDVAIGITTSGNSPNVIEGIKAARNRGMLTVGLTGASGGALKQEADYCLCVSSTDTPRIQEVHMLVGHILCEIVEHALFAVDPG